MKAKVRKSFSVFLLRVRYIAPIQLFVWDWIDRLSPISPDDFGQVKADGFYMDFYMAGSFSLIPMLLLCIRTLPSVDRPAKSDLLFFRNYTNNDTSRNYLSSILLQFQRKLNDSIALSAFSKKLLTHGSRDFTFFAFRVGCNLMETISVEFKSDHQHSVGNSSLMRQTFFSSLN